MKSKLLIIVIVLIANFVDAQVAINKDGSIADGSALIDIKSTEKGMLIPRMTQTQIEGISNPADGLMVYNTETNSFYYYNGGANIWEEIGGSKSSITPGGWEPGDDFTDPRDGNIYGTVQIGTQIWMTENLKAIEYSDGSPIDLTEYTSQANAPSQYLNECYYYNNDNSSIYGVLYTWTAAMNSSGSYDGNPGIIQGVCPDGWHIPTQLEWYILSELLGSEYIVGGKLKETGTDHWNSPNTGATNESGFTGLPGGFKLTSGFGGIDSYGCWWTSKEVQGNINAIEMDKAVSYWLRSNTAALVDEYRSKSDGYSIRCIKN